MRKIIFLVLLILGAYYGFKHITKSGRLDALMDAHSEWEWKPAFEYYLGKFYVICGRWARAIHRLERVVEKYPEHKLAPVAQYSLAGAYEYYESGNKRRAIEEYKKVIDLYPDSEYAEKAGKRMSYLR